MDKYFKYLFLILLIYSIIIAFIGISCDTFYTMKYGGIDLRNRVVGTRIMQDGRDPYFTKWDENTPDYYLDGRDYFSSLPVSRCTVTPALLILHAPFASINYKTQQYIWFALQEIMILVTIYLLAILAKEKYKFILIIGFMFQIGAYFWRFHVANGQIYILYTFLITSAYFVVKSNLNHASFWSGFILGITAGWRPPILVMSIPFLIQKKWKLIFGGVCGLFVSIFPTLFLGGVNLWKSYFAAMKIIEKFHVGLIEFKLQVHDHFNHVEGVTNSFFSADVAGIDTSIQGVLFNKFKIIVLSNILWSVLLTILIFFSIFLFKKRIQSVNWDELFYWGTVLLFLSEFFLPSARLSYNNVLWFLPVSLLVIKTKEMKNLLNPFLLFFVLGIAANYLYNINMLSIMLADFSILAYLVIMFFKPKTNENF